MKGKRWQYRLLCGLGGYFLLIVALTWAESRHPEASIQSFGDAMWYSIVTLSTVGYGDLYPVTPIGKLVGLLFVLLSVGALAVLVGSVVSLLTGRMLPQLQLRALRDRKWYVFSQMNNGSVALARSLAAQDPEAVLLFPSADKENAPTDLHCRYYPDTMAAAVTGKKDSCCLFVMDEQSGVNYSHALQLMHLGHEVYCRTEQTPDHCPQNLHLFNRYECCAREYWNGFGLRRAETTVVLIGDGRYARQLLEQGLLVNILAVDQAVTYHLFGDWSDFRRSHPQLGLTVAMDTVDGNKDSLLFHTDEWNADADLLFRADRILLCSDDDQTNVAVLRNLRRYFPVSGAVHLRSAVTIPGEETFGTDERIYTAENILSSRLNAAARAMNEIYRSRTGGTAPGWEQLREFTRQSNIAAADHLLVKLRLLLNDTQISCLTGENCRAAYQAYCQSRTERAEEYRALEHLRWMRFHSLYNWRYAPVRNNDARTHPMLVPYEALSESNRAKDDYAWELLAALAQVLE